MNLSGKRMQFRKERSSNPNRVLVLLILVVLSMFLLRSVFNGEIEPINEPTPLPTRSSVSYASEGEAYFFAGNLDSAISSYQQALELDPENSEIWAELARILTYSSSLLTTDEEKLSSLEQARDAALRAIETDERNSTAHAVYAFVLDWLSNPVLSGEESERMLVQAEQSAVQAITLDNQNTLALAYYAEILIDQLKWNQAILYAEQALERDSSLMDVHRIYGYVMESIGDYTAAINAYEKAVEIAPNLTLLHIQIGLNYRILAQRANNETTANNYYERALEYFEKAALIGEQLGIQDPVPYISIGKTYTQMGEFFVASTNMRKALTFRPSNADIYAQLGVVYFKARNYEGAIEAFKCAIQGCSEEESCTVRRCDEESDEQYEIEGLPLSASTVVYYYSYGSVLAAMHRPYDDKCTEALEILGEVKEKFSEDLTILSIISESESICQSFGFPPLP